MNTPDRVDVKAFPAGTSNKEPDCRCKRYKRQFRSLGQDDPLEEGMETHSNIPAWRIPWTGEPGRLQSIGWQRVRHSWSGLAHAQHTLAGGPTRATFSIFSLSHTWVPGTVKTTKVICQALYPHLHNSSWAPPFPDPRVFLWKNELQKLKEFS